MSNNLGKEIKRLLFTDEPYTDESFIGYILRLAELNEIPDIRWILRLVSTLKHLASVDKYNFEYRSDISILSGITGIDAAKLRDLFYVQARYRSKEDRYFLNIFNQNIHQDLFIGEPTKICPICLMENNYCRKIWELKFITACPIHRCLLLSKCPSCNKKLKSQRPKINLCGCRFDLRTYKVNLLKKREIRLSNYIYQAFNHSYGDSKSMLGYPLNTLSLNHLVKLLYFVMSHFANHSDVTGFRFMSYLGSEKKHEYLNSAVRVFDNWAANYYEFIKSWTARHYKYYISERSLPTQKFLLKANNNKYQPFNFVLRTYFKKPFYPFLYSEFAKVRKKFRT